MVKCEFCLNYDGISCREPKGVKYKQPIEDSFEEIECSAYLEKGVAGLTGMDKHGEVYKPIFESLNVAMAVFSRPDGSLIKYNQSFLETYNHSEKSLVGKSFHDFIVPEDLPQIEENFKNRLLGKEVRNNAVVRTIDGNGKIVTVELHCSPYNINSSIEGVSVLILNPSEK